MGSTLAFAAFGIIAGTGARWVQLINQVRIPKDRGAYLALNAAGAALGIVAIALGTKALGTTLAAVAIVGGLAFIGLNAVSGQATTPPAVAVGGAILDFTGTDDAGQPFALSSLRGKPFLLKFFRGHW